MSAAGCHCFDLSKLGVKTTEALPGIIGAIISWIHNRSKEVVGWLSHNIWALIIGMGGLLYMYMVTKKYITTHLNIV